MVSQSLTLYQVDWQSTKNTYFNECIVQRLIPFIKRFHSDGQYVFWPDLASFHYAKTVIEYFRDKKVNFVEKEDNPPNVPECRPIEDLLLLLIFI